MVDAVQRHGLVPNRCRPISLRKDYPVTVSDDTVDTGCDSTNAVFVADATESGSSGTSVVDAAVMTDGHSDDTVDTGCDSTNAVFAADATESGSSGTGVVDTGVMTDGPIDDTIDTGCDSTNAVFAADATESGSSGTGVIDAGVTTDGPIDDTIDTGCDSTNAVFAADATESGIMTDGPIDDTVDTGCDSTNAVFAADATESGSSGTGVVDAGVMTDGPIDDTIDTGCDSTNAVFAADATESGSCGTVGGVGGAASCVPGNDNGVGGSAIDSICKGTDGTHEVLTDGISDDCDYANDSGFIDDNLCNSIADTNYDGLGFQLLMVMLVVIEVCPVISGVVVVPMLLLVPVPVVNAMLNKWLSSGRFLRLIKYVRTFNLI